MAVTNRGNKWYTRKFVGYYLMLLGIWQLRVAIQLSSSTIDATYLTSNKTPTYLHT